MENYKSTTFTIYFNYRVSFSTPLTYNVKYMTYIFFKENLIFTIFLIIRNKLRRSIFV